MKPQACLPDAPSPPQTAAAEAAGYCRESLRDRVSVELSFPIVTLVPDSETVTRDLVARMG